VGSLLLRQALLHRPRGLLVLPVLLQQLLVVVVVVVVVLLLLPLLLVPVMQCVTPPLYLLLSGRSCMMPLHPNVTHQHVSTTTVSTSTSSSSLIPPSCLDSDFISRVNSGLRFIEKTIAAPEGHLPPLPSHSLPSLPVVQQPAVLFAIMSICHHHHHHQQQQQTRCSQFARSNRTFKYPCQDRTLQLSQIASYPPCIGAHCFTSF
jgi:hypothetical protein